MFIAALGTQGSDFLFHMGYGDHADHSDYSDASMREEIVRMAQEARDLEHKILLIRDAGAEEIRESYASLSDNIDKTGALSQEIYDCFDTGDKSVPIDRKLQCVTEALTGLVNKEQERLKAIDQTIARINQIELESSGEGKK